jgi:radical SAM protein with 4Fe4S-binding SPASM domain
MMLGNIREKGLTKAWKEIRASEYYNSFKDRNRLKGKCGVCEYREICGGCRNRAYAYTGDIYESDPACPYIPKSLRKQEKEQV